MTVMLLWTWAKVSSFLPKFHFLCSIQLIQSLEDEFDGANRRNLRHFIQQDQKNNATLQLGTTDDNSIEGEDEVAMESDSTYYYVSNEKHSLDSSGDMDDKRKLMRIPTCAVFHKIARGKGVPHTFIGECLLSISFDWRIDQDRISGFIRQWPALPRVVVCSMQLCLYGMDCQIDPVAFDRYSYQFACCP